MSLSIQTNVGAMTALRSLQATNSSLAKTQDRVSTGLKVASARDNAAIWAVSSKFRVGISSNKVVEDGLGVALSATSLARGTAERIVDMLGTALNKALARAEMRANGDPNAAVMSNEIGAIGSAISDIMSNASFNGINMLQSTSGPATPGAEKELWYFSRTEVMGESYEDWSQYNGSSHQWESKYSWNDSFGGSGDRPVDYAAVDMRTVFPGHFGLFTYYEGFVAFDGASWSTHTTSSTNAVWSAGSNPFGIDIDEASAETNGAANAAGQITLSPASTGGGTGHDGSATFVTDARGTTYTIANANLSVSITANSSFSDIESALTQVRQAAATLGAAEQRLEAERSFSRVYGMALERGQGALVDADMTEESARLQALQVQQQLGSQAMAIANRGPQILLQLF